MIQFLIDFNKALLSVLGLGLLIVVEFYLVGLCVSVILYVGRDLVKELYKAICRKS